MLHATVITASATIVRIHVPVQLRTAALLAEIAGEGPNIKETYEREEFSNSIL